MKPSTELNHLLRLLAISRQMLKPSSRHEKMINSTLFQQAVDRCESIDIDGASIILGKESLDIKSQVESELKSEYEQIENLTAAWLAVHPEAKPDDITLICRHMNNGDKRIWLERRSEIDRADFSASE